MPVYIGDCKQDLTVVINDKKVCVRCSVLGLCFLHRPVDELTTPARARLAPVLQPHKFVSGECSSTFYPMELDVYHSSKPFVWVAYLTRKTHIAQNENTP